MITRNLEMFPTTRLEELVNELPSLLLPIDETYFSVRTQKCLFANEILVIGDLVQLTEQDLLRIPNFGRKSLREVISILKSMSLHLNVIVPDWPPENISILQKRHSNILTKLKNELYLRSHQMSASCLEEELFNFASLSGERNAEIFVQRMGWDGHGGKTLDEVGKKYGMTRERVRQICSKIEKKIQVISPPLEFLQRAIDYANKMISNTTQIIQDGLVNEGICSNQFELEGLLSAAEVFHLNKRFVVKKLRNKVTLAVGIEIQSAPKKLLEQSRRYIEHWGVGTISDISRCIEDEIKYPIPDSLTTLVLESSKNFSWLDQERGWFWIKGTKRNRVLNLTRKILSVSNKVHISDLREGIRRPHRMSGYSPPRKALIELCRQSDQFQVEGNFVYADPPLNWEEEIASTQWVMVCALKEYGPVMKRSELESICLDIGIKRSSFFIYLDYAPFIKRYSRGVYGIRGAEVTAVEIEQIKQSVEIEYRNNAQVANLKRVLIDYGWDKDGKIWVAYKLSESTVLNGVVTMPSQFKQYIDGEFNLYSLDGAQMGVMNSSEGRTWGLSPFFNRRGGEAGDYLVLLYDLVKKKVTAELGDEGILDKYISE